MMDWTDKHFRYFLRIMTRHTVLYTEMITTGALIHGDRERFLAYHASEHPVALQLGGSNPVDLALCAKMAEAHGYDEVNLNVGCPSATVQQGKIGACLMAEPALVAECIASMKAAVRIPVTLKTRIGIDDLDSYAHLHHFISLNQAAGCEHFILHARKAWLTGLSPKQNRDVPPLRYEVVRQIKQDFPQLTIAINGGISDFEQANIHLDSGLDGVMIGRAAYQNPYLFAFADQQIFDEKHPPLLREAIIQAYIPYIQDQLARGARMQTFVRFLVNLYLGVPGARIWRQHISTNAHHAGANEQLLIEALDLMKAYQSQAIQA
jgi:tRNA-dihydrouridine synthase A